MTPARHFIMKMGDVFRPGYFVSPCEAANPQCSPLLPQFWFEFNDSFDKLWMYGSGSPTVRSSSVNCGQQLSHIDRLADVVVHSSR